MQRALGIDLGTTNSVMAYNVRGAPQIIVNRDNGDLTPSVVGRGKRGELLVGAPARARAFVDPLNTISSIKRFMGRKFTDADVQHALQHVSYKVTPGQDGDVRVWLGEIEYTPAEISSLILRRLKEDAEARTGERFTRAVITVPAYFGERQVAATREAGRMAGFHVLQIINEPTAAALAYGLNRQKDGEGKTILVYDLGGGTFDISILMLMQGTFAVLGIEGDNLLGGDDFDRDIMERLLEEARQQHQADLNGDKYALQKIRSAAEEIKIRLSNLEVADIILPGLGRENIVLESELSRAEFEDLIRARTDRTIELTNKAITEGYLSPDTIDQILLVGGSTSIPMIQQMLQSVFGDHKLRRDVNPMQCVAIGAAIQTAVIGEIDCLTCGAKNTVDDDECIQCRGPLYGLEKINCSTCMMLSDATESTCWKCGSSLGASAPSPRPSTVKPKQQAIQKCPKCDKSYGPGEVECSFCSEILVETGGLSCQVCGHPNAPGAKICRKCGSEMTIGDMVDITAKNLGIEVKAGQMSILIPKGTAFPIEVEQSQYGKEYYIAHAGQRRLEIEVFEGPNPIAKNNDLCGIINMGLPEGLPIGTPINVTLGLDSSRTITLLVTVRVPNILPKRVAFSHNQLDPELRRKVEEQRRKLTTFMDRWTEELTEAERQKMLQMLDDLDTAVTQDSATRRQPLEPLLKRVDTLVEGITRFRSEDAYLTATIVGAGKYLSEENRAKLFQLSQEMNEARERADWEEAAATAQRIKEELDRYGDNLHMIVACRAHASQGRLSPALAQKVFNALRVIDEGMDKNDGDRVDNGLAELYGMWDDIQRELRGLKVEVENQGSVVADLADLTGQKKS